MRRLDGQPKRMSPEHGARVSAGLRALGRAETPTKRCPRCKNEYPRESFGKRPKSGYSPAYCRPCTNEISNERFTIMRKDPKWREHMAWLNRRTVLRIKYGITVEEYDRLAALQGGVCKICKRPPTRKYLDVDHCHDSNQIRGLLCSAFNTSIGLMREDPALFHAAAEYVSGFHLLKKESQ